MEGKEKGNTGLRIVVTLALGAMAYVVDPSSAKVAEVYANPECTGADGVCGTPSYSGGGSGSGSGSSVLVALGLW